MPSWGQVKPCDLPFNSSRVLREVPVDVASLHVLFIFRGDTRQWLLATVLAAVESVCNSSPWDGFETLPVRQPIESHPFSNTHSVAKTVSLIPWYVFVCVCVSTSRDQVLFNILSLEFCWLGTPSVWVPHLPLPYAVYCILYSNNPISMMSIYDASSQQRAERFGRMACVPAATSAAPMEDGASLDFT